MPLASLHAAPIGVDSSHRYFTGPDGKPVFLMGYYMWAAAVDGEFIDHPSRYQQIMADGQPYGLNYIRLSLGINRFTATTDPPSWNNQPHSTPFEYVTDKADLDQWNAPFWAGVKNQIEFGAAHGYIVHVCFFDGFNISAGPYAYYWNNSFWNIDNQIRDFHGDLDTDNDQNAEEEGDFWRITDITNNTGVGFYQRRLIDKAIAEVGSYDNVMFELGNETFRASTATHSAFIDYIRTRTTKVITINPHNIQSLGYAIGDGASQHAAMTSNEVKTRTAAFAGKGWPAWEDPDGPALMNGSADDLRRSAWYSLAGGGAGWGGFSEDFTSYGTGFNPDKATYYGHLIAFLKNTGMRFWTMVPSNFLVSNTSDNSCLADNGREYLVYVLHDSNVTIDLTAMAGSARCRVYDPRTGAFGPVQTVTGGTPLTLNRPPYTDDWVVHIVKTTIDHAAWTIIQPWNGTDSAVTGDADSDGLNNLLEYALDLDPLSRDSPAAVLQVARDDTTPGGPWLTYTYRKNLAATDLTLTIESSTDLTNWADLVIDGNNAIEEIADPDPDGDNSAALIRIRVKQLPADPLRFLRLRTNIE